MSTQQGQNAPKSIKDKSLNELEADMKAAQDYKAEQERIIAQGQSARLEIGKRLGHELMTQAGKDLQAHNQIIPLIRKAHSNQLPSDRDVILLAVVVDNSYASMIHQELDGDKVRELTQQQLTEHLGNGVLVSSIGLKDVDRSLIRNFDEAYNRYHLCKTQNDKLALSTLGKEYGYQGTYNPQRFLSEE